eukprot:CAMPEP_0176034708 /NCGR_PEP_ID=MMETSP0120_2-20121206/17159_1 /TAXON_ID=160619 /ORGANISM="Kryptoperidinium foliaceum, Strain CCMP 1326" /LENGTH=242 /DNA_ID=CAMNT_0017368051 /DNA_START=413 /DNA_END=1139 /DNA_ORIENTATION=+
MRQGIAELRGEAVSPLKAPHARLAAGARLPCSRELRVVPAAPVALRPRTRQWRIARRATEEAAVREPEAREVQGLCAGSAAVRPAPLGRIGPVRLRLAGELRPRTEAPGARGAVLLDLCRGVSEREHRRLGEYRARSHAGPDVPDDRRSELRLVLDVGFLAEEGPPVEAPSLLAPVGEAVVATRVSGVDAVFENGGSEAPGCIEAASFAKSANMSAICESVTGSKQVTAFFAWRSTVMAKVP